jgi:hypothetical protein
MADDRAEQPAIDGNGRRHNHALAAAILIVTIHSDPSLPERVRFDRIMGEILDTLYRAEEELARAWLEPSEN